MVSIERHIRGKCSYFRLQVNLKGEEGDGLSLSLLVCYHLYMLISSQRPLWEAQPASSESSHSIMERLNWKKVSIFSSIHTPTTSLIDCDVSGATAFSQPSCTPYSLGTRYIDVGPIPGRGLIFQREGILYSGEIVTKGVKYSLRTDIMYEVVPAELERA